ncbi:unnamed protein product [Owenia fusiformis]|uniref:EF-hand domain-containing protein n=1 Tax=Owenia fusiformis TaxID=6347 RepID=A0A8S4PLD9_OWEFU|nr:unnamed protein product [Owenia fusiformis]
MEEKIKRYENKIHALKTVKAQSSKKLNCQCITCYLNERMAKKLTLSYCILQYVTAQDDDIFDVDEIVEDTQARDGGGARPVGRENAEILPNVESFNRVDAHLRLEEKIQLHHLQMLSEFYANFEPPPIEIPSDSIYAPSRYQERDPESLNLDEFKDIIGKVLGTNEYTEQLEKLFVKLDTSCDGYVDWDEFCTYMLLQYRENDYMRHKRQLPFTQEPRIRHIVQNRQEVTTKIVAMECQGWKYVTISKEGAITVFDQNLHIDGATVMKQDDVDPSGQKRRFKMWITDAVYMPNCHKIAISSTGRDIRFFDASTSQIFEEFNLYGLNDVPHCLDYHCDMKNPEAEALLLFGNDCGAINLIYFTNPMAQLFGGTHKKEHGVSMIYMKDVMKQNKWTRISVINDVHPGDIIRKIEYLPHTHNIISSSGSSKNSLVIMDINRNKKSYVFQIGKGCDCFDYNRTLSLLVTGSSDYIVRLWNPFVPAKPIALLRGHTTGVIGVKIHESLEQIFSYSKESCVKVWDIKEHTCLQTVQIKFPSSIFGRIPEHGSNPLHLQGGAHNALVACSSDYISLLKCGVGKTHKEILPSTHNTQLCCAIYNEFYKQVVTGADDSTVCVWDIDSGAKCLMWTGAHGNEEITTMIFDRTWRRLFTGARNGTMKVWNFQNGHNINKAEPVSDTEITGLVHVVEGGKNIIAVGWSRLITIYDDSNPDNAIFKADNHWKGGQLHQDDILAIDYCSPNLLATGSFDGEILVWTLDTEKLIIRLKKGSPTAATKKPIGGVASSTTSSASSKSSRPNSRHRKRHKLQKGQPAPVDKLLFLAGRASSKRVESATLISSEAGTLFWWCIFGQKHELGSFYAPELADESVLALSTNPSNSILLTGDTTGNLAVWNILEYCVQPERKRVKTAPPLETSWRGHDGAVASVEFISHAKGKFILSSSTDKTAKLWDIQGHHIGTFGQSELWDLKNPKTWEYHKAIEAEANDMLGKVSKLDVEGGEDGRMSEIPTLERGETLTDDGTWLASAANNQTGTRKGSSEVIITGTDKGGQNIPPDTSKKEDTTLTQRPQTFPFKTNKSTLTAASNSSRLIESAGLGVKMERELIRRQADRQERREHFGENKIDPNEIQKFEHVCSPYQALVMPELKDFEIPTNLPVSTRMHSKGYHLGLNNETIKNMNLSYMPDSINTPEGATDTESVTKSTEKLNEFPAIHKKKSVNHSNLNSTTGSMNDRESPARLAFPELYTKK